MERITPNTENYNDVTQKKITFDRLKAVKLYEAVIIYGFEKPVQPFFL